MPVLEWKRAFKLGKKKTILVAGVPKKLVFTKLRGRGDAREFYISEAYIRHPVKWDTTVYGPLGYDFLSAAQIRACDALIKASRALAGINRIQRKIGMSQALKGKDHGGRVKKIARKPIVTPEELAEKVAAGK